MKWNGINIITLLLFFAFLVLCACSQNLEERLKAMEAAHNNQDVEKHLSFYSDTARFVMLGQWIEKGSDKLRGLFEWDAAINSKLNFYDIEIHGDTVKCKAEERNDFFKIAGLDVVDYEFYIFIYKDGLINEVRAKMSLESIQNFGRLFTPFVLWSQKEKAEEFAKLSSGGQMDFAKDKAEYWLELMREFYSKQDTISSNDQGISKIPE
jgi:hypothetical protein